MTHQNHQTNGASLEDCHTNFFALTDLCGIKWRKFVNGERQNASSEPLDDPILRSYSRCIQADILCVWRRVQSTKQESSDPNALTFEINSSKIHPPLSLAAAKELWIFWYGEEPDLSDLVDSDLLRVAANQTLWNGTWERGLTYECRSLLFKALHNLMERFVLTKDIVRFGKWFVQPCTSSDRIFGSSSQHLSFSFTFFVHGDTVCASIDLREHPAVRPLTKEHLAEAAAAFSAELANSQSLSQSLEPQQNSPHSPLNQRDRQSPDGGEVRCCGISPQRPKKVILAPFGMAAILTGNSFKITDPMAEKILEDWASFFPLCNKENTDVPPVVEVISGGHKMYHPSTYVLVTDLDEIDEMQPSQKDALGTTFSAEAAAIAAVVASRMTESALHKSEINSKPTITNTPTTNTAPCAVDQTSKEQQQQHNNNNNNNNKYKPYYDAAAAVSSSFLSKTANTHAPPKTATELPERAWQNCITNSLHVAYSSTSSSTIARRANSNNVTDENSNCNSDSNSYNSNSMVENQHQPIWEFVDPTFKAPCTCTKVTPTPHGTPHGGASTYSRNCDSMAAPSVGSPGTPAHSPQPISIPQPTSIPSADPLLNMSPHAPTSVSNLPQPPTPIDHLLDKNTPAPTPTDQSTSASPYVHPASNIDGLHSGDGGFVGGNKVSTINVQNSPVLGRRTPPVGQQQLSQDRNQKGLTCATTPQYGKKLHKSGTPTYALNTEIKLEPNGHNKLNYDENHDNDGDSCTTATISGEISEYLKLYKAPKLNVKNIDVFANEDCIKFDVLYDFTDTEAWLNHSTKHFKPIDVSKPSHIVRTRNLYERDAPLKFVLSPMDDMYGSKMFPASSMSQCNANMDTTAADKSNMLIELEPICDMNNSMQDVKDNGSSTRKTGFFHDLNNKSDIMLNSGPPCKKGKTNVGRLLYTAEGLHPSLNDLEQLFETSSNDECSSIQINTPPDSNNLNSAITTTIDEFKRSKAIKSSVVAATSATSGRGGGPGMPATILIQSSNISTANVSQSGGCGGGTGAGSGAGSGGGSGNNNGSGSGSVNCSNAIQVEDLTKMFPTPPSHEHHPNSSPCQMDVQMTDINVLTASNLMASVDSSLALSGILKIKQEYSVDVGSPIQEPIEDWTYVYKPPQQATFASSTKYAPLTTLPSQTLPPLSLTPNCMYEPSWVKQHQTRSTTIVQAVQQQQQQHQTTTTTTTTTTSLHTISQQQQQHAPPPPQLHHQHQHQHQQQQQQQHQHHHHQQQQQQHQQQQQQQQSTSQPQIMQHQQLHELLSAPRTPLQQHRPSSMCSTSPTMHSHAGPMSANNNSGNNLLLNQLNCPQGALTNTSGNGPMMQQFMQRTGLSPISPASVSVPFARTSPMLQPNRQTPILPPPPYELAVTSPATSTSSYLNKQFNSQEPPQTPQSAGINHMNGAGNSLRATANFNSLGVNSMAAIRELPEVSSLIVNILLYDTALNVFRDHNFDSSTVCVCNADSQKIGNIRGADSGLYVPLPGHTFNPNTTSPKGSLTGIGSINLRMLSAFNASGAAGGSGVNSPSSLPGAGQGHVGSSSSSSTTPISNQHTLGYIDDDPVDCTCGFSAVVNRRLAHRAGLFYEDEMDITGIAEDPRKHKKLSLVSLITNLSTALNSCSSNKSTTSNNNNNNTMMAMANSNDKSVIQADQQVHTIYDLLMEQCPSIIQTSSSSIHRAVQRHRHRTTKQNKQPKYVVSTANVLEYVDANDIMCLALEQARLAFENNRMEMNEFAQQHQLSPFNSSTTPCSAVNRHVPFAYDNFTVHKWPYIPVGFTRSNKDIVRTMNAIQPMLQNAFHSKSRNAAGAKDATYTVSGPLTWRQFHRLAGRASGQCEPQPIPSVIVGHDKDWISVAPLAIHYWDKFLLEPYSYARDVVYLILCPDNDYVVNMTKVYFKELSSTYEMCKLGRHTPMRGWDGMLTIGARRNSENCNTLLDDWLRTLSDVSLAEKIRLYANAFQNMLVPFLNRIPGDKTLLNPPESSVLSNQHTQNRDRIMTSSMISAGGVLNSMHIVGTVMDTDKAQLSPKIENANTTAASSTGDHVIDNDMADVKPDVKGDGKASIVLGDPLGINDSMEDLNPPAIVLYVVEPFSFGSDSAELERLACIALLRCYSELLKNIPDSVRANINIQIISLESILELGCNRSRKRFSDEIKCVALNIFAQCRRHMVHAQTVKSLTGFGTAANMEVFLKSKDEKNRQPYKMYTPPYILAPVHEKNDKTDFSRTTGIRGLNEQKYSVMYCNYCMSEDQSWLLATVTDDRGELLEKICINIDVPNRTRRRMVPARRVGLKKLMDFILGLISQTAHPWRLVVGRIGRIGHSELKSWSYLLSKQNLQRASKQLKDICKQCTLTFPPSILSACLVTLEPDSKLRVMPDQFTPDERFSQISMQNPLSTPQDVTCTHILVFPTSAVCLSFTRQFQNEPQVDLDNDFLNFDECEDENEAFPDADIMSDLFWDPQLGRLSNHGSPDRMEDNRSWQSACGNNYNATQQQDVEEVGSINQQPLAVGYLVSTAPTGRMPAWFWAACPHLEDVCPVFLKTALHLHVPNIQTTDDILNSTNAHSSATDHPLDSTLTADVLRYVLEGYNALSWLALDSNTHDRLSCLPVNVQTLMDLYYLTAAIA